MTNTEIVPLAQLNNKLIAEEIKRILEDSGIYVILESDNPASSVMNVYFGSAANDHITIKVVEDIYKDAVEIIKKNGYENFLV